MGGKGSGRKPILRGLGVYGPQVHLLWHVWLKDSGSDMAVDRKKHAGHPLCRVTGNRKFTCTDDATKVTCRACLKRMALTMKGEEAWRDRIIRCYTRIKPSQDRPKPGMAWPV